MKLIQPVCHSILFAGSCLISLKSFSQNMNSPYSIYGIGDIDNRMYNRTSGMAGTGLATRSSVYFINNNPSAISGLTRSFFVFNISAVGKTVQYSGEGVMANKSQNKDLWLKGINLAVKLNNFWASSVGFRQFSNVNYKFIGTKDVIGSSQAYSAEYEGNGGLNDYYWTNAFSIGKHFSVGIKSSIIAGSINRTETVIDDAANTIETKQQDYYGSPQFQYGAQYRTSLNKKWDLSIGGKYISTTKLASERTLTVTENSSVIVDDKFIKATRTYLPQTYGLGISLSHYKKTTFAADYTYENWTPLNIGGNGWRLISSNRLSAGVEFSNIINQWNQSLEKRYFQFGGFISSSYLRVHNTPVNEFGVTTGMGGVLSNSLLYNLSLEVGKRGTTQNKLIKENFLQLTLGLTYRDFLFSKGKKYN
jgi:hypothetical protein